MTDHPDTPPPVGDAESLAAKYGLLEKQVADYKLLIADMENSRKRLAADADRERKYAHEKFARDLLTPLDTLDWAAKAAATAGDAGPLAQGVAAAVTQFLDVLKRYGVTKIEVGPGGAFDPMLHQAVMQQPTNDVEPGAVVSVMQAGFVLHDRVLRPASVVVASEPPSGSGVE